MCKITTHYGTDHISLIAVYHRELLYIGLKNHIIPPFFVFVLFFFMVYINIVINFTL